MAATEISLIREISSYFNPWYRLRTRISCCSVDSFDALGTLEHLRRTGHDYSWFILDQQIIRKEFALSGSEQNPDLTGKSWRQVAKRAVGKGAPAPVEAFKSHGRDFIVRN